MSWKEDVSQETQFKDKYVQFKKLDKKGDVDRVTLRVLDGQPENTFRHWYQQRPYNCPGNQGNCPVCIVRRAAQVSDADYQNRYRMENVHVFNVLADGKVKLFVFKQTVGAKLREFIHEYGDLRNYDVVIVKRKNGPMDKNIEWDVLYKGPRELTQDEQDVAEEKFDLLEEIKPAPMEVLVKVAREENMMVQKEEVQNEEFVKELATVASEFKEEALTEIPLINVADTSNLSETFKKFVDLVHLQGKVLEDYGVDMQNPPSDRIVKALVKQMSD